MRIEAVVAQIKVIFHYCHLGSEVNRLQLKTMSVFFFSGKYVTTAWVVQLLDQDRWPGGCSWLLYRQLSRSIYTYLLLKSGPETWNRIFKVSHPASQPAIEPDV